LIQNDHHHHQHTTIRIVLHQFKAIISFLFAFLRFISTQSNHQVALGNSNHYLDYRNHNQSKTLPQSTKEAESLDYT